LLTNDDGINSAGIKALMKALPRVADVVVVAPATNNSGVAQSLTYRGNLRVYKRDVPEELKDSPHKPLALYAVEGTPATCVLLGLSNFAQGRPFDMVISGINPGTNLGADGNLSGTVGAARMGADMGVAGLAVSSGGRSANAADVAASLARFIEQVFSVGVEKGILFNVNYPRGGPDDWKGAAVTGIGAGKYLIHYRQLSDEEKKAAEENEKSEEAEGAPAQAGALLFRARFGSSPGDPVEGTASHGISNGKICVTPIPSLSLTEKAAQKGLLATRARLAQLEFFK
ncbi:MAG: 5'/3'-nucleotidase SurE, partial [Planctomycetota bacterium]|nr:5'/3'-nucleotidase SurE [Planctomycetota bacterium]